MLLHEFDRDSSKKHVLTVNLCFEALQVIFFHDLLDVYECFMTVKRLLFTRGCGDGSYENYVFIYTRAQEELTIINQKYRHKGVILL